MLLNSSRCFRRYSPARPASTSEQHREILVPTTRSLTEKAQSTGSDRVEVVVQLS